MKKVFVVFSVFAVLALAGASAYARGKGGCGAGGPGFGGQGKMQQELGLTDDQQAKLFKINQDFRQKMFDSRKDTAKQTALRDEHRKNVEAVFTADQKAKLDQLRNNRGCGFGKGGRW